MKFYMCLHIRLQSRIEMGNNPGWKTKISYETIRGYLNATTGDIVSVGSGLGEYEKRYELETKRPIICVDPDPTSYDKRKDEKDETKRLTEDKMHLPDYPVVDDLIKAKPDLVGKCTLLLLWPTPNESSYDAEAIGKLKPVNIVVVWEIRGAAGSEYFHQWIDETCSLSEKPCMDKSEPTQKIYRMFNLPKNYSLRADYSFDTGSYPDSCYSISLITKIGIEIDTRKLKKGYEGYDD